MTLMLVAALYCLLCGCVFLLQRKLIYYPARFSSESAVAGAALNGFQPWRDSRGEIMGWRMAASAKPVGNVLIVHGNAGCALQRDYIAQPIHEAAALDVFVLEYPGYGARPGSPDRTSMVNAADRALQLMAKDIPTYLVSESLGTGVAGELIKRYPLRIRGAAMFVPYHSLAWVAQRQIWIVPSYFLLRDRFEPAECLVSYHGPVQFVVAGADEVIGSATGIRLANGYAGPKQLQIVPGAGHNDVAAQSPEWWRRVIAFWTER